MPTAAFASHYWPGDGEEAPEPEVLPSGSQYPHWFDGSTVGTGYAPISIPRRVRKRIRGFLTTLFRRYFPERLFILARIISLLFSPDYGQAREVVRGVARNPASRSIKYWTETQVALTRDPNVAENTWRGVLAGFKLAETSTLPRPDQRILLELAHLAHKTLKNG